MNRLEVTWQSLSPCCKRGFIGINIINHFHFFYRQIEFLSELAVLEGSFTDIGYWYIGLTDLGKDVR